MDSPATPAPTFPALLRTWSPWLMVVLLLGYGAFLTRHVNAIASSADASGYLNHARLLASGRVHVAARTIPELPVAADREFLYTPLGFLPKDRGTTLIPSYPPGLPLLIATTAPVVGWEHAADVVLLLHALAGVALMFALGRALGLTARWAFVGAAVIAVSPLYLQYAVQAMSDLPALVWCTAAVLAAWRSREKNGRALAAGAALSLAVLIRPNNALLLAPIAIALGFSPRRWLLLFAGALPGAVFFCAFNHALYGGWFVTGYGDTSVMFGKNFITESLLHYVRWLPLLFTPVVLAFLLLPAVLRSTPRAGWVLATWALAYLAFYAPYRHTHQTWWFLRFVLPAAPALVLGGLLGAREIVRRRTTPFTANVLWVAALGFTLASSVYWTRQLAALDLGRSDEAYRATANWTRANLPGNAVLATMQTSGALFYYTDFTLVRRDQFGPDRVAPVLAALAAARRPFYAVLFQWEIDEGAFRDELPGRWTRLSTHDHIGVWRYDGPAAP